MCFRLFYFLTALTIIYVQCYVPIPTIYHKAESALKHYSSQHDHNPIVFSLLNVIVYDKRAKAFISSDAIELSLADVKKYNSDDETILRDFIYHFQKPILSSTPDTQLKEDIESTLDLFFSQENLDDVDVLNLLSKGTNFKSQ